MEARRIGFIVSCIVGHVSPTPPPLELFVIRSLGLVTINVYAKFEIPIFTHYGNMKCNAECIKYGDLDGYGSLKIMGNVIILLWRVIC